jgi:hypothetical protein
MIGKEGITAIMAEQWAESKEEELKGLLLESAEQLKELVDLLKIANEIIVELQEDNRRLSNELERRNR